MSKRWFRSIDPKYSYQHIPGFITDGRGRGVQFHASTRSSEIAQLVKYLDQLETKIEKLQNQLSNK